MKLKLTLNLNNTSGIIRNCKNLTDYRVLHFLLCQNKQQYLVVTTIVKLSTSPSTILLIVIFLLLVNLTTMYFDYPILKVFINRFISIVC